MRRTVGRSEPSGVDSPPPVALRGRGEVPCRLGPGPKGGRWRLTPKPAGKGRTPFRGTTRSKGLRSRRPSRDERFVGLGKFEFQSRYKSVPDYFDLSIPIYSSVLSASPSLYSRKYLTKRGGLKWTHPFVLCWWLVRKGDYSAFELLTSQKFFYLLIYKEETRNKYFVPDSLGNTRKIYWSSFSVVVDYQLTFTSRRHVNSKFYTVINFRPDIYSTSSSFWVTYCQEYEDVHFLSRPCEQILRLGARDGRL